MKICYKRTYDTLFHKYYIRTTYNDVFIGNYTTLEKAKKLAPIKLKNMMNGQASTHIQKKLRGEY